MEIGIGIVAFNRFTFFIKTNGKHYTSNSKIAELFDISTEELNDRLINKIFNPNQNHFNYVYIKGNQELVFSVDLEKIDYLINCFKKEFNNELTLLALEKGSN